MIDLSNYLPTFTLLSQILLGFMTLMLRLEIGYMIIQDTS